MPIPSERTKQIERLIAETGLSEYGLGRHKAEDARDRNFPLRAAAVTALVSIPPTKYWPIFTTPLNQLSTPRCVAFSWTHFLQSTPVTANARTMGDPAAMAGRIYARAQQLDEWEGEDYDGTSVRAGARTLREMGLISEYRWAFDAETARDFVLSRGPIIFGTDWHVEMFLPDADGFIEPIGEVVGGHAYAVLGFSHARDAFRILNSWGTGWGQRARAWLRRRHAAQLIEAYGEVCSAFEIKAA